MRTRWLGESRIWGASTDSASPATGCPVCPRSFRGDGHDWRRQRRVIEPSACGSARTYSPDAGHCSVAGIEYVWQHGADVLVRVNPQSFVACSAYGRRISLLSRLRTLSKVGGSSANGGLSCMVKVRRLRADCVCSTKERLHGSTGSSALAAQSE